MKTMTPVHPVRMTQHNEPRSVEKASSYHSKAKRKVKKIIASLLPGVFLIGSAATMFSEIIPVSDSATFDHDKVANQIISSSGLQYTFLQNSVALPQFDPSLGTLNSVELVVESDIDIDTYYFYGWNAPYYSDQWWYTFVSASGGGLTATITQYHENGTTGYGYRHHVFPIDGTASVSASSGLENFIGAGSVNVAITGTDSLCAYWNSYTHVDTDTYGSVTVTLNYDYTPLPLNNPPTAAAGADQTIRAGDTVLLNGSASFDDNTASPDLQYAWSFSALPPGSTATLTGADTATPSFVADLADTYVLQLVVTDEAGLASVPDEVVISSANLAPTAVATVNYSLIIIGETAQLNGAGSTDPETDALSYSWTITAAPPGSTAALVGANTPTPTLTPGVEGAYEVTLEVSDFLGAGTPATVAITATTAAGYAELKAVEASDIISGLSTGQITTKGNQQALQNFLSQVLIALQAGDVATAIDKLQKTMERTDGCVLRGAVDGNGPGRDWITDCAAQTQVFGLLTDALDALRP